MDLFGESGVRRKYSHYERLVRSAEVSECGRYRYWLRRSWQTGGNGKAVCFVMLNPSKADAMIDDPTVVRCMNFTRSWGYSIMYVVNLFAFRATDPRELKTADDPVGPRGDVELAACRTADLVIAAWGPKGTLLGRDKAALRLLAGKPLHCLRLTKYGHPQHPLFVRADAQPMPFVVG